MRLPSRSSFVTFLVMALPTYGFVAIDAGATDEFVAATDNIEHVKQLEYADAHGTGPNQGTDLEFATVTLPPTAVTELGKRLDEPPVEGGVGDADHETPGIQRTYSFAGSYNNGLQIVDVTDPAQAEIVAVYDCGISQGDVQVFGRDGGTYVTYTHDTGYSAKTTSTCFKEAADLAKSLGNPQLNPQLSGGYGTFIADVSDPYAPATVSFVPIAKGSHNQTVHPSGDYLYNSNSDLITSAASAGIEIFDIRDFAAPKSLGQLDLPPRPGLGTESHDLSFNADGTRAYSAALSQTVIIDTEDPESPSIISSIFDPAINVEHQAEAVTLTDATTGLERTFLIVEDEFVGAQETGQCPNGGVHIYDITGELELAPVKVGYWNINEVRTAEGTFSGLGRCTAHVFELHPDEGLMTIAYYHAGVRVVDISGLIGVALSGHGVGMKEVAFARFADSDTWAVKAPYVDRDGSFHIFGNDQRRGMDIYRVDLGDAAAEAVDPGQWLTPAGSLQAARLAPADLTGYTPYCLLGDRPVGAGGQG